jgi:hypothetical protein
VNDYDPKTVKSLAKYMPVKELLQCSAELYDIKLKEHMRPNNVSALSPEKFSQNLAKSLKRNVSKINTFDKCFPAYDSASPVNKESVVLAAIKKPHNTGDSTFDLLRLASNEDSSINREIQNEIDRVFFRRQDEIVTNNIQFKKLNSSIIRSPTPTRSFKKVAK